ncbi:MAG: hypothetical protein JWM82_3441 [Myxococcales bacterium]|nr:hypothetical protein [Myxococcales bacterium]
MPIDSQRTEPASVDAELTQLEAELAAARERVAASASSLQRQLEQATDWRTWVAREAVVALGLAFGLGFLLGRGR